MESLESVIAAVTRAIARRAPEYIDLEDIAQEARIECWRSAPTWDASRGASLPTFLYTCGFRAGLRWIRSEARWRGITEAEYREGIAASREAPADGHLAGRYAHSGLESRAVSNAHVSEFLQSLSDRQRVICHERMRGLTSREISYLCDIHSSSVRRQLMTIRRRARAWLHCPTAVRTK